jgi:hypothetical protein
VSAQTEIESLIAETQQKYNVSPSANTRADLLGREAFRGLVILAKHIDAISERLEGINPNVGEGSVDFAAEFADLRKQLKKLAKPIENLPKMIKKAHK